uniref:DUF6082 family protein n=1 Tax=Streptomyces olivochromogenes TaxID=1963 RepID=UPI00228682D1
MSVSLQTRTAQGAGVARTSGRRRDHGQWTYRRYLLIGAALLALLAFLLCTPLALLAIGQLHPGGWARLSDIAGTYGDIATVFSMLALAGVAASLILQARDNTVNRELTHRSMHSELLSKALDDPGLRACWGPITGDNEQDRQHIYTNLIFSFWRSMFEIGMIDEDELRALSAQIFSAPPGRRYWALVAEHHRHHHVSDHDRRFTEILDREHERALANLAAPDA